MTPSNVTVTRLFVHPVKSMAGRGVPAADVHARGLVDDRSWMVVDTAGQMVTARTLHTLLGLGADTPATDPGLAHPLRLRAPGLEDRCVDLPEGPEERVVLFGQPLTGVPADPTTQSWLGEALGRSDLRLVWCARPEERQLNPAHGRPGDHTAYADGYPITLVSEESLTWLNDWIVEGALERGEEPPPALGMERFRPNVVIRGAGAFAEDGWSRVRVGDVTLRLVTPSPRCALTTVDLSTFETGREPIRTLARHRRVDGKVLFAVNAIPESAGRIRVGDAVEVVARFDA